MTITHGGYNFQAVTTHDDIVPDGAHQLNDVVMQPIGVNGESEITDRPKGRDLSCRMTLWGYGSEQELITDFNTINSKANKLTGTITVTGNSAATFKNCSFKGATREAIRRNAVNDNYWVNIFLRWRQLKRD